jgi:hypothetical protein
VFVLVLMLASYLVCTFRTSLKDVCENMKFDFHTKEYRRLNISRK